MLPGQPEVQPRQGVSPGRVVLHRPATVHRHPDIASVVERETVGRGAGLLECHQRAAIPWLTGGEVDVKLVQAAGAAVVEIHDRAVGAPADPVGDRQIRHHGADASVQLEPVKRTGAR